MIHLDTPEAQRVTNEMNHYLEGATIEELISTKRKRFYFETCLTLAECRQDISVLDLSPRAYNCLRRTGYNTIGCLLDKCYDDESESSKKKLLKLRNLGKGTADEILIKLFFYQFDNLPKERKKGYMKRLLELNSGQAKTS